MRVSLWRRLFFVSSLLKTILLALFRTFGLPPRNFLPSKPSFLHDHLPPNIRIFQLFSSFYNRWASRSKYTCLCSHAAGRFCVKGVYLFWYSQKTRKELSNSGYKIQIKKGWKVYSRTRTFGATEHKSNIRVKRWHNTMSTKIVNWTESHNFCSNDFLTKSNRTEIQTYKVEERTFRTPCIHTVEVLLATTLVSDQL